MSEGFDDTTEQIIPWRPEPFTQGVTILDPEHTVAAPLDATQAIPAPGRVQRAGVMGKRILMFLLIFDVLFGTFTVVVLSRMTKPHIPSAGAGTTPETPVVTVTMPVTTPVPTVTLTTQVQTTAAPRTTMVESTQAPKTTAACRP